MCLNRPLSSYPLIQHIQTSEFFIHIAVSIKQNFDRVWICNRVRHLDRVAYGSFKTRGRLLRLLYRSTSPYSGCCMDTIGHTDVADGGIEYNLHPFWGALSNRP